MIKLHHCNIRTIIYSVDLQIRSCGRLEEVDERAESQKPRCLDFDDRVGRDFQLRLMNNLAKRLRMHKMQKTETPYASTLR